jgi:hypothetical protein
MPHSKKQEYLTKISNPFLYFFFMLWRLPSLIFWGVKLKSLSDSQCETTLKQKWTNQNPFGSVYFSALNGAAELSTGLLFQLHLQAFNSYSMLVVESHSQFKKKAKGRITFTCKNGDEIMRLVEDLKNIGDNFIYTAYSEAFDDKGINVGSFKFTWSAKRLS